VPTRGPRNKKTWKAIITPLPVLVYDRCFFLSSAHYRSVAPYLKQLQRHPKVQFLGHGLAGKWEVYTILSRSPDIRPHLPETDRVYVSQDVLAHLARIGDVVIKPLGGSLGRKVIRITKGSANTVHLSGRDGYNRPFFGHHPRLSTGPLVEKTAAHRPVAHPAVS